MDLAEPLLSLDESAQVSDVKAIAVREQVALVGIRRQGRMVGYVNADRLGEEEQDSAIGLEQFQAFNEKAILDDRADLQQMLACLIQEEYVFVRVLGEVVGAIGRLELEKPAMRMWLFGTISTIEMNVTWAVQLLYPKDTWIETLSSGRLDKAQMLRDERERRGQFAQLLQCLQFSDKLRILAQDPTHRQQFFPESSRRKAEKLIKQLESLRNNLAHAQPIVDNNWEAIQSLASAMDRILQAQQLRSLLETLAKSQ